jgi:hypothetical protein
MATPLDHHGSGYRCHSEWLFCQSHRSLQWKLCLAPNAIVPVTSHPATLTLEGINTMLKHVHANAHAITSSELSDTELSLTGEREACLLRLLDELIRIFTKKGPKPTSVDLVLFTDKEGILLVAAYTLEKVLGSLERAYL